MNGRLCPVPKPISTTSPDRPSQTRARMRRDCLLFITTLIRCGSTRSPYNPMRRSLAHAQVVQLQDLDQAVDEAGGVLHPQPTRAGGVLLGGVLDETQRGAVHELDALQVDDQVGHLG